MNKDYQIKIVALIGMWVGTSVAAYFGHTDYIGWAMFLTFLIAVA